MWPAGASAPGARGRRRSSPVTAATRHRRGGAIAGAGAARDHRRRPPPGAQLVEQLVGGSGPGGAVRQRAPVSSARARGRARAAPRTRRPRGCRCRRRRPTRPRRSRQPASPQLARSSSSGTASGEVALVGLQHHAHRRRRPACRGARAASRSRSSVPSQLAGECRRRTPPRRRSRSGAAPLRPARAARARSRSGSGSGSPRSARRCTPSSRSTGAAVVLLGRVRASAPRLPASARRLVVLPASGGPS